MQGSKKRVDFSAFDQKNVIYASFLCLWHCMPQYSGLLACFWARNVVFFAATKILPPSAQIEPPRSAATATLSVCVSKAHISLCWRSPPAPSKISPLARALYVLCIGLRGSCRLCACRICMVRAIFVAFARLFIHPHAFSLNLLRWCLSI